MESEKMLTDSIQSPLAHQLNLNKFVNTTPSYSTTQSSLPLIPLPTPLSQSSAQSFHLLHNLETASYSTTHTHSSPHPAPSPSLPPLQPFTTHASNVSALPAPPYSTAQASTSSSLNNQTNNNNVDYNNLEYVSATDSDKENAEDDDVEANSPNDDEEAAPSGPNNCFILNDINNNQTALRQRKGKTKTSGKSEVEYIENKHDQEKCKSMRRKTLLTKVILNFRKKIMPLVFELFFFVKRDTNSQK
jgi:hypothetical protein